MIGNVQITHAWLEDDLRFLWSRLNVDTPDEQPGAWPKNFHRLIAFSVARVGALELADDARGAILDTLQTAKDAHVERGRLVHDAWLRDRDTGEYRSGKEIRHSAMQDNVPVRSIVERIPTVPWAEFENCLQALRGLRWRMRAVDELLSHDVEPLTPDDYEDALTIALGHFRLGADGHSITWPHS